MNPILTYMSKKNPHKILKHIQSEVKFKLIVYSASAAFQWQHSQVTVCHAELGAHCRRCIRYSIDRVKTPSVKHPL